MDWLNNSGPVNSVRKVKTPSLRPWLNTDRLRFLVLLVTYFIAALAFTEVYFDSVHEWRQAPLEQLAKFTAEKPF